MQYLCFFLLWTLTLVAATVLLQSVGRYLRPRAEALSRRRALIAAS